MLHAGSLRAIACMLVDVGMFVLVSTSVAMAFVDHGVRGFTRRDRRLTTYGGLWLFVLRALGVRLFAILVLLRVLFPGLPICSVYLYLQKGL